MEYLPWAQRFARAFIAKFPAHLDHDNLQGAGMLGYLRAASKYDVSKGASFRGFCALRIRGAILDELRRWGWAPRSVHKNQRRISRVTSMLIERLEREPTCSELAHELGLDPAELASYQSQAQPRQVVSLDEVTENQGDDHLSLTERLPDPHAIPPDVALLFAENWKIVRRCLRTLPKTETIVIVLHYLQYVPLRDVAALLEVTPSRVSQLHQRALGRLRLACHRLQVLP